MNAVLSWIRRNGLWIIFFQSLIAMLGSLYYGRYGDPVANFLSGNSAEWFNPDNAFLPCELCRYARILMYPMVWFSAMGLIYQNRSIINYFLPISIVGILLESYHYLLQKVDIPTSQFCTKANPCDALQVNYLDFITIPFLCGVAFIIIFATIMIMRSPAKSNDTKAE